MNRFSIACRAFAEGLAATPKVEDLRTTHIADARRAANYAREDVRRCEEALAKAKARVAGLETKLEQLEKLPDEAFSILLS